MLPCFPLLLERGSGLMQPRSQAMYFLLGGLTLLLQGSLFALCLLQSKLVLPGLSVHQALGKCPRTFQLRHLCGFASLDLGGGLSNHPLEGFHHAK